MPDPDPLAGAIATIELIAAAIRDELGTEIDAYPGFRSPAEAGPENRAFRAIARALLARATTTDIPPDSFRLILRGLAERRLAAEDWDERQVRHLIEQEAGEDWLAYLLLSSRPQIEPLLPLDISDPG